MHTIVDGFGVSTATGISTDHTVPRVSTAPDQTNNSQLSSNTVLVAGVAVSVIVLVLAAVCIVVLVVWLR